MVPIPSVGGAEDDEVRITGLYGWDAGSGCRPGFSADFEVTNSSDEAATYTVTLGFRSSSGGALTNAEQVVEGVGAGKTVKASVLTGAGVGSSSDVTGVSVVQVRSVPVAEASTASGPCPASGVYVYVDKGDAAMGLRAVGLHLANCGEEPFEVNGYPQVEVLDEDHDRVDSVRVLKGTGEISTGLRDGTPQALVLRPGEAAQATLAWRNTTEFGEAVNAPYARVRVRPGADPVMVIPELDLGTTGKLGVGSWEKDDTYRAPETVAPTP
ncbi:DUF4232 domain-containing protein [Streptomyces davaonensis]|uniref:DUF4232 domain-containing protein n=1 Tax=Streptomyces davaonensis TaxID=348043 RepID=UPI0003492654|nr:DUF4232 domain-containing protein [Streptomyces davaonensis]